jgi:hypothetical protein
VPNDTDPMVEHVVTAVTQPTNGNVRSTMAPHQLHAKQSIPANDGSPTDDFTYT